MGFFKKLFEKKVCDLCGGEIGLLGNRKLEDGNCCKNCANQLSRWFDDRRHATVEQIREQLVYRGENEAALKDFHATKVIGEKNLVYIDEKSRRFFVARDTDYMSENPDILTFEQVLSCELDIDEYKKEIMREVTDKEGNTKRVSYSPKRYLYQYNFEMIIRVQHPYFDDMRFRLNDQTLELESGGTSIGGLFSYGVGLMDPTRDISYRSFVSMGEEIKQILTSEPAAKQDDAIQAMIDQIRNATDMETATRLVQTVAMMAVGLPNKDSVVSQASAAMAEVQMRIAGVSAAAAPAVQKTAGPKFCPACGAPANGGKFCEHCGTKLQ